jgi:hypothetical protein
MRALLILYLLGELDEQEHEEVQRRLAESAELRRELAYLRSCLKDACWQESSEDPPSGLAERTMELLEVGGGNPTSATVARNYRPAAEPPAGVLGWSLADLTVAGGVVLAVSMLIFPALGDSRNATRRNICQNNQRQLWLVLTSYAEDHGGYYPRIEPHENAGSFTVELVDKEYISAEELSTLLVCPGAPLADAIRAGRFVVRIPTTEELQSMTPAQRYLARRNMSPFYAYRFPYRVGGQYYYIRHERRPLSAILADTAGTEQEAFMSPNHGGAIVQVMSQDGSVKSLRSCMVPGFNDELFVNAMGVVAAGLGPYDIVLGSSGATPEVTMPLPQR